MHQLYITHNSEVMLKHIQNIISFLLLLLIFAWTSNSVNINSLTQLHNPCWIVCCQLRKGQEPTNTKNKHIATFSCSSLIERKSLGESDDDYCTGQQEVGKLETKKLRGKKTTSKGEKSSNTLNTQPERHSFKVFLHRLLYSKETSESVAANLR